MSKFLLHAPLTLCALIGLNACNFGTGINNMMQAGVYKVAVTNVEHTGGGNESDCQVITNLNGTLATVNYNSQLSIDGSTFTKNAIDLSKNPCYQGASTIPNKPSVILSNCHFNNGQTQTIVDTDFQADFISGGLLSSCTANVEFTEVF